MSSTIMTNSFNHPFKSPTLNNLQHIEQESLYTTLVETLAEGVAILAADGKILSCNESAKRIFSLSADQIEGREPLDPGWEVIYEDGRPFPHDKRPSRITLQTGQALENTVMGVRKPTGELIWISINTRPLYSKEATANDITGKPQLPKKPIAVLCTAVDITNRKQSETLAFRNLEIYRNLVSNLPDSAVLLFDYNLRYISAAGAALSKSGFKREAVEGKTIWEVLQPEDAARLLPYYQAALGGIENIFEEYYDDRVYLVRAMPIINEHGQILAGMLVSQEITELRRAERLARAEKNQLSVTLQSIGDGVITTDLAGRVTLLNRVAENLTGWKQREALGQPVEKIFDIVSKKTGLPEVNPIYQTLSQSQTIFLNDTNALVSRDGTQRHIAHSSAPIRDYNGVVQGAVLVFQDVTEKHRLTEELLKSSKLDALGVLAGGIAHDFNNLLTVIVGNLNLIRLQAQIKPDDTLGTVVNFVEEAEAAALRSKDITNQLLTFARGGMPVKKAARLPQLIEESAGFALHGANVQAEYELDSELWPVEIDSGQISQVIQNLVLNAVQAMPNGGQVKVDATNRHFGQNQVLGLKSGDYVQVKIEDRGMGISPENLKRIFDPYFTTKTKGNGLGLAVCYSVIKQHGGIIEVESTPGKGTSFFVYLPAASHKVVTTPEATTKLTLGTGRILVMDDDQRLQSVAQRLITHLGYESDVAGNGQTALKLYEAARTQGHPFDLVMLDLTIPGGMGGKETMARLRMSDPGVKAVVCSGYSSDPIMANYADYGFLGVLVKPYRLSELSEMLKQFVG